MIENLIIAAFFNVSAKSLSVDISKKKLKRKIFLFDE